MTDPYNWLGGSRGWGGARGVVSYPSLPSTFLLYPTVHLSMYALPSLVMVWYFSSCFPCYLVVAFDPVRHPFPPLPDACRIWKKNSPFLYDLVMTHALEWPSLTVQWLPGVKTAENNPEYATHKLLFGTHTAAGEDNYLIQANVNLPLPDTEIDAKKYEDERGEVGGFGGMNCKVEVKVKIAHEGEVNRARYMPQNPFVVATKGPSADVYVFDITKHPSAPGPNDSFRPEHVCKGHAREGYGLAWSPAAPGQLLSGSDDARVCLWDMTQAGKVVEDRKSVV